jgi:hypothetical protein
MSAFTDPRTKPAPDSSRPAARLTAEPEELNDLHQFCREGRLYAVERWIQDGRPLQLPEGRPPGRRRWSSALEIALDDGNHALVLLLLCNGYDPNRERHCSLDRALEDRRTDLLDLLLEWGADPHRADLSTLFGTYDSDLFERFRKLGVDLTAGHALAAALAHHTSNKPLYGYAKRRRKSDPKIQTELNIALSRHASDGNEKGVSLCLWAGADPHAPAPSLRWGDWEDDENEEEERFVGFSAVYRACGGGNVTVLEKLGPDPDRDDFDELYEAADNGSVVDFLARSALPEDLGAVLRRHFWWVGSNFNPGGWRAEDRRALRVIESIFRAGARWEDGSKEDIAVIRAHLRKASERVFIDAMKLLAKDDYCSPEILHELARTPAMRRRMKEVGFIPPDPDDPARHRWHRNRPTRFQEVLKKCGIELKKPERPLPRTVRIGSRRSGSREVRMTRRELFDRVWTDPVTAVAEEWGLSDRGLAKACSRLKVPTPPRGYWPKVRAGKRVRRPKLPDLPDGQAEEIVVWMPEE